MELWTCRVRGLSTWEHDGAPLPRQRRFPSARRRADRVVARAREDHAAVGGQRQRAHVAQVTVHRRDQVARDALVVVLRVSGERLGYALAQSVGTQRLRVPEVNAAVATCRRQVVQRGAEGEDAHVALVRVDRLQEGEAGRHNSISTRTPFPRPTA